MSFQNLWPFLFLIACSQPVKPAAVEGPNLILISLDTVRADHLEHHGYLRQTTPHLKSFAETGWVFENAVSPSPWTLPAHTSILTGQYPLHHGVHHKDLALGRDIPTLATHLSAQGFQTGAITNSGYLKHRSGLHRGFDAFRSVREDEASAAPTPAWDAAAQWIHAHKGKRFFFFLHIYDPHSAYRAAPPHAGTFTDPSYAGDTHGDTQELLDVRTGQRSLEALDLQQLTDLYDENLLQTDAKFGQLLRLLDDLALSQNTYVVVTSDHGEALGEHGEVLHGRTHYQELLHVPMVARGPGLNPRRVAVPVSTIDIVPTVSQWLASPFPTPTDGVDLSSVIPVDRALFAEADQNAASHNILRTVRLGDWKLTRNLHTKTAHLVNLSSDPAEEKNLTHESDAPLSSLNQLLDQHLGVQHTAPSVPPLSTSEQEHLKRLGYLDGDPKR